MCYNKKEVTIADGMVHFKHYYPNSISAIKSSEIVVGIEGLHAKTGQWIYLFSLEPGESPTEYLRFILLESHSKLLADKNIVITKSHFSGFRASKISNVNWNT